MNKKEKSICWLGVIPECDKDKVRYPTEEEINQFIEEAEKHMEQDDLNNDLKPRSLVTRNKVYENYLLHTDGRLMRQYKTAPESEIKAHKHNTSSRNYRKDSPLFRNRWTISDTDITSHIKVSIGKGLTFPELVGKSPLVRHFNLKFGDDIQAEIPSGQIIRLLVNMDHIDQDQLNDEFDNLRFCTQFEQILNTGPRNGHRFKGVCKVRSGTFQSSLCLLSQKYPTKCFKTEEEAALHYNKMLKEALKEKFGNKLGQELIDEVAYFNDVIPEQQELDF